MEKSARLLSEDSGADNYRAFQGFFGRTLIVLTRQDLSEQFAHDECAEDLAETAALLVFKGLSSNKGLSSRIKCHAGSMSARPSLFHASQN